MIPKSWQSFKCWNFVPDVPKGSVPNELIRYKAFELCKPENVKVIILGQDPYPNGEANGLAFSCREGVPRPPTLSNVFQEYEDDLGFKRPPNNDLSPWARNGVLLLNCALTTLPGCRGSHVRDWERFTFSLLSELKGTVGILWGKNAQQYGPLFDHAVKSPHPSPLSARTGFFGSKPFSKTCLMLDVTKDFWRL